MNKEDEVLKRASKVMEKYCFADASHTNDHFQRVLKIVEYLIRKEGLSKQIDHFSLQLAVILHDLGQGQQVKFLRNSPDKLVSGRHVDHSLAIAARFLREEGFSKEQIKKIKNIIASHGTHGQNNSLEGDLLHDADLLDGIGLVGVFRKFTYGGQIGRGIVGSLEFTKNKILNRKFRTKTAQKIGRQRVKRVQQWLEETEKEIIGRDLV